MSKKLNITLEHWTYECGDGCCTFYGTDTTVNGEKMPFKNQATVTILKGVLEHLGYKVNIEETFDFEEDE